MKKYFIVFVLVCVLQIHLKSQNYDFELPCDTLTTQLEMNRCTGLKSKIIDSLVNTKYNCFKKILENDFKQSMSENDTLQANYYEKLIDALDGSQKSYLALAKANRLFYNNVYDGGSMRGMVVNLSSVADGLDRLKKLDDFIVQFVGEDSGFCE